MPLGASLPARSRVYAGARSATKVPACLAYEVACDRAWRRVGAVRGRIGDDPVEYVVVRTAGGIWTLNGAPGAGLDNLADLDFGFTPATHLQQLRRIGLTVASGPQVPVAWLDTTGGLVRLPQRYERRTESTYWYEAPTVGYAGELVIGPDGFARRYPGLWEGNEAVGPSRRLVGPPSGSSAVLAPFVNAVRSWGEAGVPYLGTPTGLST